MLNVPESWISCDRCGEKIKCMPKYWCFGHNALKLEAEDVDTYAHGFIEDTVGMKLQTSTSVRKRIIDLCPRCKKEFKRWLNNE